MKKYYLHDGTDRIGPFDIEELRMHIIDENIPVWYEGMPRWNAAKNVDELKSLFIKVKQHQELAEQPVSFLPKKTYMMILKKLYKALRSIMHYKRRR
jgi:uncharacterized protein (DUF1919 family)